EDAGAKVVDHHIGLGGQPQQQLTPLRVLHVDADTTLAMVDGDEVVADVMQVGWRAAGSIATARSFYLDHVGTKISEQHGGKRPGEDMGEVEDTYPHQWALGAVAGHQEPSYWPGMLGAGTSSPCGAWARL